MDEPNRDRASDDRSFLVDRMAGFGTTIFAEMSALATETGSINLGQGFPDTDGPDEIIQAAVDAMWAGHNQYPPGPGIPELRTAVSDHQARYYGITLDPDTDVLVTTGATEGVASAVMALAGPGDEVVMFEPYFDSYAAVVALSGATRRVVRLSPPDYRFDAAAFEAAFSPRTRVVLFNSPHNPTGKVFDRAELEAIAEICIRRDVLVATDEVYEHLAFDGQPHIPLSTLPGMAQRTVSVSSAGKTFSLTGWKIGWVTGPADLVTAARTVKQFLTYVSGAPLQHGIATALGLPDEVISGLRAALQSKRDRLCNGLESAGFDVFRPQGTYFVLADISPLGATDGLEFCRQLPKRAGVVAIPNQVFYDDASGGRTLVRFAFCKRDEVIDEAVVRLGKLGGWW